MGPPIPLSVFFRVFRGVVIGGGSGWTGGVLAVGDPRPPKRLSTGDTRGVDDLGPLPFAAKEARTVASLVPRSHQLSRVVPRLLAALPSQAYLRAG